MKTFYLLTFIALFNFTTQAAIVYVDETNSSGTEDGTSWANAYTAIPSSYGLDDGDQVWIANGVYFGGTGNISTTGLSDIKYYGGFNGNETSLNQRNPDLYVTTITNLDNAVRVSTDGNFLIDGLTFYNCSSTQNFCDYSFLWCDPDQTGTITFRNCNFLDFDYSELPVFLTCSGDNNNYDLIIDQCEFINVDAETLTSSNFAEPVFTHCHFLNCDALVDGTTFLRGSTLQNCHIENFTGARLAKNCEIFSCLFENNSCNDDGGAANSGVTTSNVVNCTFAYNASQSSLVRSSDVFNTIFYNNSPVSGKTLNQGCTAINCVLEEEHLGGGFGNFYFDPEFVNGPGGDYHLTLCSPAINASFGPQLATTDLDGFTRTFDGIMDLGCYEVQQQALDIIYVNVNAPGGDGKTWATAYKSLYAALNSACSYSQVWVAKGTYYPDDTPLIPNRTLSFVVNPGVELYGGFIGTETQLWQRDVDANETNLSGAIGLTGISDNSYHVVKLFGGVFDDSRVDGFTIRAGNANGAAFDDQRGAGMYCSFAQGTVANCLFEYNYAIDGGAMYLAGNGELTIEDCVFENNDASDQGGAVHTAPVAGLSSVAWFDRCIFQFNTGDYGGAIYSNDADLTVSNSLFYDNLASSKADGIYVDSQSFMTAPNLTVYGHQYTGIYVEGTLILHNGILWENDSHIAGDGEFEVKYSTVQGGWSGTANYSGNPDFIDPGNGNFRLEPFSNSVDTGLPSSSVGTEDLDNNPRTQNGIVDRGAYEFDNLCDIANDFCENATVLASPYTTNITTDLSCGSTAWETLAGCVSDGSSIWYRWSMGTQAAQIVISPLNAANVNFSIFTGSCGNLTPIVCVNNNSAGNGEGYALQTTEIPYGQTVYLRIGSDGANAGQVSLIITPLECVISQVELGSSSSCNFNDEYQQEIVVHHSHAPGNGHLVVNDQYFSIQPSPQSVILEWEPADGLPNNIDVYFSTGSCSFFQSAFYTSVCCKANDDCFAPRALELDHLIIDDNLCATNLGDYTTPCANNPGQSVWFSFVAPASGEVEIRSLFVQNITAFFRIRQALFLGGCTVNEYVGCSNTGLVNQDEIGTYAGLTPGATYLLRIDGANAQRGVFSLEIEDVGEASCPADYNNDGTIDTADLLILLGEYGCSVGCLRDLDGDDLVNTSDLLIFLSVFGSDCP